MEMGSSQMSRHVLANHHFATGHHLTHVQSFTIIFRAMNRNHHRNQGLDKSGAQGISTLAPEKLQVLL